MPEIKIMFFKPNSLIGDIVCLFTGDQYSHSVVEINQNVYSSEIPRITKTFWYTSPYNPFNRPSYQYILNVTQEQATVIESWVEHRVGKLYDCLSLFGWLFGIKRWQWRNRFYCHEFCREALEKAGIFEDVDELITAERLMSELSNIGASHTPPKY